ncbi:MAG TPA: hypothetical protein VHL57_04685, partial [Flavobacteriales bacterium]|nr:hypothetical protein [Flavobacteriales bacterium]
MRTSFLFACTLSIGLASESQAQWTDWHDQYPLPGRRIYAHALHATPDGNYLLCGSYSSGFVAGQGIPIEDYSQGFYLVKITPDGDTLWTRQYAPLAPGNISVVMDLHDGNTFLAGTSVGPGLAGCFALTSLPAANLFTMAIDPQGDVVWSRNYQQPCDRYVFGAWESPSNELHVLAFQSNQPT